MSRFERAGHGVLEGFLEPALVTALRRQADRAPEAPPIAGCERPHNRLVPLHALLLPGAHAQGAELPLEHDALRDQPGARTLATRAGNAIVLDYRLLHGTQPNASAQRRECVLLSFTPSWRGLPADARAHLVQHLALPGDDERPPPDGWPAELLPRFDGARAELELSRAAPAHFAVVP